VHLVGCFHNYITMLGLANVKFTASMLSNRQKENHKTAVPL